MVSYGFYLFFVTFTILGLTILGLLRGVAVAVVGAPFAFAILFESTPACQVPGEEDEESEGWRATWRRGGWALLEFQLSKNKSSRVLGTGHFFPKMKAL